jgi:hypothetical protein
MRIENPIETRNGQLARVAQGAIVCLVAFGVVATYFGFKRLAPKPVVNKPTAAADHPGRTTPPSHVKPEQTTPVPQPSRPVRSGESAIIAAQQQPSDRTARARQLLASLTQFDPSGGVSAEKAAALKQTFKLLAQEGTAALPAIREFLDRLQDIDFESAGAEKLVGYSSLRIGLLDVLGQIGGPEAVELSLQTLQKTSDSQEIAFLAKMLERQLPPDQFRPAALAAAGDVLAQAIAGKLEQRSVTPLFEVLQRYGDDSVVGVLEQAAGKWNYYATLALAGLPDGVGIPGLIRLAQDPAVQGAGNGDVALRPLAQAAMEYPDARVALIDQARANQIPERAWPTVAASLAGNYMQYGDHIFGMTVPSVQWSTDQINSRVALIDQMLGVTSNSAGQRALQSAREVVLNIAAQVRP